MPPCSHRPSVSLPRSAATPPFRATQAAGARSVRRAQTPTASAGGRRGHTPSRRRRSCAPSWASACATNRARTMAATTTTTQFGATSRARPARRRQAIPPTSSVRLAPLPPNPRPGLCCQYLDSVPSYRRTITPFLLFHLPTALTPCTTHASSLTHREPSADIPAAGGANACYEIAAAAASSAVPPGSAAAERAAAAVDSACPVLPRLHRRGRRQLYARRSGPGHLLPGRA